MSLCAESAYSAGPDSVLVGEIDRCIKKVARFTKKSEEVTAIKLDRFCAGLGRKLSPYRTKSVTTARKTETSLAGLRDLRLYINDQVEPENKKRIAKLNHRMLGGILSETLVEKGVEEPGWWKNFLDWLNKKLGGNDAEAPQWLTDFLKSISLPKWLGDILFQVVMVALVLSALLIIGNEWRHTGFRFFSTKKRSDKDVKLISIEEKKPYLMSLRQIKELPSDIGIVALLEYCISALVRQGLLPDKSSQTNREMYKLLMAKQHDLAECFLPIVNLSENRSYGGLSVNSIDFAAACSNAQSITDPGEKDEQ